MNLDVRSLLLLMKLELVFSSETGKCLRINQGFATSICYYNVSGLNIVEQSLWKAVPHYLRRVSSSLKKVLLFFSFICKLWMNNRLDIDNMLFSMRSSVNGEATPINLHPNKVWFLDGWRQRWKSKCHCKGEQLLFPWKIYVWVRMWALHGSSVLFKMAYYLAVIERYQD